MKDDNFLSGIMGFRCGIANLAEPKSLADIGNYRFAYSKTDVSIEASQKALSNKFYLADVSVMLRMGSSHCNATRPQPKDVSLAEERDRESVTRIAFSNFSHDRFHCDPNIPDAIASEIKCQWVGNFFSGIRGDQCFVARSENLSVKGFLLSIIRNNEVVIDLIAVDSIYRRKGVAKNLIDGMLSYYQKDYAAYSVGTQLNNTASVRLYESIGYQVVSHGAVWHYYDTQEPGD